MKRIIKDYFTFSKKERTAIIILLLLIACFIAAPYLYSVKRKPPAVNQALVDFLAKNRTVADSSEENVMDFRKPAYEPRESKKETFPFDPNTISAEEWKRLGVGEKTVRTILNYRNKGGKFRSAEDIRKIWGFKKEDADRLIPFVQMQITEQPANQKNDPPNPQLKQPPTRNNATELDINTATVEEWKALPGIGEVLANRIIKFRERIGGFASMEQFHKTYGISDSVFQVIAPYLKINPASLPKLNLNTASAYDIRKRLNVSVAISKAIIMYREQYGPYQSVTDLKKIVLMSDTLFQRIAPILKIE